MTPNNKLKYNLQLEEIIEMLKSKKVDKIAIYYGCSTSNIYLFCKKNSIKIPEIDLVGKKWNRLLVENKLGSRGGKGRQQQYWNCLCDCGNYIELSTKAINSEKNISCGCWMKSKEYRAKRWNGYGDIHGKWWYNIKRAAKTRGHCFEITIEYAWDLFRKQNGKCALTKLDLVFGKSIREVESGATTASLDRIDSDLGYIIDNVHWIHKDINFMKQDSKMDKFISYCKLISENN